MAAANEGIQTDGGRTTGAICTDSMATFTGAGTETVCPASTHVTLRLPPEPASPTKLGENEARPPASLTSSFSAVKMMGLFGVPLALTLPPRQTKRQPKSLAALVEEPLPETPLMTVPGSMFRTALLMT